LKYFLSIIVSISQGEGFFSEQRILLQLKGLWRGWSTVFRLCCCM